MIIFNNQFKILDNFSTFSFFTEIEKDLLKIEIMDDDIAALLAQVAKIENEEEEEEKNEKDEKDKNQTNEINVNSVKHEEEEQQIEKDDQNSNEEIFMVKKIIKIDDDQATIIRRNEIIQQVDIVSKEISNENQDTLPANDDQGEEFDLDDIDIDWHYHTPSTK